MFTQYNKTNYANMINKQIKKEYVYSWKNKFNKKRSLQVIYEGYILRECIIIEKYF